MDLNTLKASETVDVHLEHPATGEKLYADDDNKKPLIIVMATTMSKKFRDIQRANKNAYFIKAKKNPKFTVTAEMLDADALEALVEMTEGVKNLTLDGKTITPANIRDVYADPNFAWLKDQADAGSGELAGFFTKPVQG